MKSNLSKGLWIILAFSIVGLSLGGMVHAKPLSLEVNSTILYVKSSVDGDCSDWDHACDLQAAISSATSGNEIWVASGIYKPTTGSDREATFQLETGVAIYGGFPAAGGTWTERDWEANPTTLSGDIGTPGSNTDNSYHMVTGIGIDNTAILDGFIISGGNADGDDYPNNNGGGMYNHESSPNVTNIVFFGNSAKHGGGMSNNDNSSPTLTNVTFSGNTADYGGGMANFYGSSPTLTNVTFSANSAIDGGGMRNYRSSTALTNVTFSGNTASSSGGGMFNYNSSTDLTNVTFSGNASERGGGMFNDYNNHTLTNVTFSENTASIDGGGMYNYEISSTLTNVTFSGNTAIHYGGGMYNADSSTLTTNAIFWGNTPDQIFGSATVTYSITGRTGTGNINEDPLLEPLASNGGFTQTHALLPGSPAIDAGNPTICPATDQRGFLRPIDGDGNGVARCDMGAYEYGSFIPIFSFLPVIIR